jgi:integral membrane protein
MLKTSIGRLSIIALIEGLSYIVLLVIAMPLKYWADIPEAVSFTGALHGLLFVLYLIAVANVTFVHRWSIQKVLFALVASIIPFGNFVLERKLLRKM